MQQRTEYPVSEIYDTISGEAPTAGDPATFVRLWYCPVRCTTCDTMYSVFKPTELFKDGVLAGENWASGKQKSLILMNGEWRRGFVSGHFNKTGSNRAGYVEIAIRLHVNKSIELIEQILDRWHIKHEPSNLGINVIDAQQFFDVFQPAALIYGDYKRRWEPQTFSTEIITFRVHHTLVVITGGEPLCYDLDSLIDALQKNHHTVQIETTGAFGFKGQARPDILVVSPKPNVKYKIQEDILEQAAIFKFVNGPVGSGFDLNLKLIKELQGKGETIYLMPWGAPPTRESIDSTKKLCEELDIRFSPRLHYEMGMP